MGEAMSTFTNHYQCGVHPRASGATEVLSLTDRKPLGPSPRERGNLGRPQHVHRGRGSIPARAGQPHRTRSTGGRDRVHPRASGATVPPAVGAAGAGGPSPRERGNPRVLGMHSVTDGSIPARAGQPLIDTAGLRETEVHPRASGATVHEGSPPRILRGPSPRERGNLNSYRNARIGRGSIPARAGQPLESSVLKKLWIFKEQRSRNSGFPES